MELRGLAPGDGTTLQSEVTRGAVSSFAALVELALLVRDGAEMT
jgi:hypothetical protein